jgi:hypothetical protein
MQLQWKPGKILKTSGSIVKVGEYQGRNFDDQGNPVRSKFDSGKIQRLYENATEPIPMYADDHTLGGSRVPVGYAFRFGMNDTKTDVVHNGYVFDHNAAHLVSVGELGDLSPEIETIVDEAGNVTSERITGLCFVKQSGISGNSVNTMTQVFSTIVNDSVPPTTVTPTGTPPVSPSTVTPPITTTPPSVSVEDIVKTVMAGIASQLPGMVNEAVKGQNSQTAETTTPHSPPVQPSGENGISAEVMAKLNAQQAVINAMQTKDVNNLIAEVKSLGIADPAAIVADLPPDIQIKILTSMKEKVFQNGTFAGVPGGLGQNGDGWSGKSESDKVLECLKEVGFTDPKYIKILESSIY